MTPSSLLECQKQLAACPFCAGAPTMLVDEDDCIYAGCDACNIYTPLYKPDSVANLIAAWNRREGSSTSTSQAAGAAEKCRSSGKVQAVQEQHAGAGSAPEAAGTRMDSGSDAGAGFRGDALDGAAEAFEAYIGYTPERIASTTAPCGWIYAWRDTATAFRKFRAAIAASTAQEKT